MRLRLFPKYALFISTLVVGLLAVSWTITLSIAHGESTNRLRVLQSEKAHLAAARIGQFLRDVELHVSWVDLVNEHAEPSSLHQQRFELIKLLKKLAQVTEVTLVSAKGLEQVFLSRTQLDRWQSGQNLSDLEGMSQALAGKVWFGKPFFVRDSEPHMLLMYPLSTGQALMADINLKLIWESVQSISERGRNTAYVVDSSGTLIAHPQIDLVLRKLSFKDLPQVRSALSGKSEEEGRDWAGNSVLSAYAQIPNGEWRVFVETPMQEIRAELQGLLQKATLVLIVGLLLSVASSYWLARRLIAPIEALRDGVARIRQGDIGATIQVGSHDELEQLALDFNQMGRALHASYSALEDKVAERTAQLETQRAKVTELLNNMLPQSIASELSSTGKVVPRHHGAASILFSDFSGFTQAAATMPAERMVSELNAIFEVFDAICDTCGIERIKTIGDSYMAVGGVPQECADHAQRCVRAGLRMIEHLHRRNDSAAFKWDLRIGIHSGPVVSGVVGIRKFAFDVWGDTVNLASRMESTGEVGRLNVSAYTYDLIKEVYRCEYRGKVSAKGKGEMDMYFVVGPA